MNWRVRECDGTSDRVWGDELLREEMKESPMQRKNEGVGNREKRRKVVNRTILYIHVLVCLQNAQIAWRDPEKVR